MLTVIYNCLWNYTNKCRIELYLEIGTSEMIGTVEKHLQELKNQGVEPEGHKKRKNYWHFKKHEISFTIEDLSNEIAFIERLIAGIEESGFYDDGMKIVELSKKG